MKWLTATWLVVREVMLTVNGLVIIWWEILVARPPSIELLITGASLAGVGGSFHAGALLSGHIGRSSSPSSSPASSSPSSSPPEASGERAQ